MSLAVDDEPLPRVVDEPRPGYFKRRVVSHAPDVIVARVYVAPCTCAVNGPEPHTWGAAWHSRPCEGDYELLVQVMDFPPRKHALSLAGVWNGWDEITFEEYAALMQTRPWNGDGADNADGESYADHD